MPVVGRLDQYASMLATEFDDYSMSENLLTYSEQFNDASWSKGATTVQLDIVTAPDGNVTSDKLVENTANAQHYISKSIASFSGTYTLSCFIKSAGRYRGYIQIYQFGGPSFDARFNLNTGVITFTNGTATIIPYSNGWYRVILTTTFASSLSGAVLFSLTDNAGTITYTGDGTSGIYLWGAQLETGSVATDYTPTTTTAINRVLASTTNTNITGLGTYYASGFDDNTSITTLSGTSGENLLTYSQDFDDSAWTKFNLSVSGNITTAPDGSNTADKLIENTANDYRQVNRTVSGTISDSYTLSCFIKSAERYRGYIQIYQFSGENIQANFNLNTGVITFTNGTATIIPYSNGWYRVILSYTFASSLSGAVTITLNDNAGTLTYTGDGTSGFYVWGAQLEKGLTATNYIPTTAAIFSRSFASPITANVFPPYDPVYDEFGGTFFGAGQGRYMRQNTDKSVIVYNEIDEVTSFSGTTNDISFWLLGEQDSGGAIDGGNAFLSAGTFTSANITATSGGTVTLSFEFIENVLNVIGGSTSYIRLYKNSSQIFEFTRSQGLTTTYNASYNTNDVFYFETNLFVNNDGGANPGIGTIAVTINSSLVYKYTMTSQLD